ncbi:hypothetical protein GCM10008025_06680 [Ornithinibacillus halotolerans]|uniref:Uncharacterized protein n=1 Tax=Ornithinibacillus halotolerans TaxID=1274357 RepID=A0A916RTG8_9BACI|nr:hypothetical protein GCM10008025_06680 [Ornithinibacillus halotolerans]
MPFLPQDKERFVSETSHEEKAFSFFEESAYISGANVSYCSVLIWKISFYPDYFYIYYIFNLEE